MLAFRSALSLCGPVQLSISCSRVSTRGAVARGACWKRLMSGETRTVRAIPIETGGVRGRLSGMLSLLFYCAIKQYAGSSTVLCVVHVHVCCIILQHVAKCVCLTCYFVGKIQGKYCSLCCFIALIVFLCL